MQLQMLKEQDDDRYIKYGPIEEFRIFNVVADKEETDMFEILIAKGQVIEDCDEYVRCIDTVSKEIVSWSKHDNDGIIKVADGFYEHFLDCIDNAIENFD